MGTDILLELGLAPEETLQLSPRVRDRLVNFLLRWRQYAALAACLDELLPTSQLLSLLDARAQMLLEEGLLDEAWDVMSERLQRSISIPSRMLATRIQLARREMQAALDMAQTLVDDSPDSSLAWGFLGEVRLAVGDHEAALAAHRKQNEINPDGRSYLLGMTALYQARGDWVTASAYAVRLQQAAIPESPLPVNYLRRLREYFLASKELNRVADIDAELSTRYAAELAGLQQALEPDLGGRPSERAGRRIKAETPLASQPVAAPAKPIDSFEAVRVDEQERQELKSAARRMFGHEDLLPGQAEIMSSTMRGEDVLAVLPTGGGKSLCYQLPALLAESGTTLVISPLIALMKDQVDKLPAAVRGLATRSTAPSKATSWSTV